MSNLDYDCLGYGKAMFRLNHKYILQIVDSIMHTFSVIDISLDMLHAHFEADVDFQSHTAQQVQLLSAMLQQISEKGCAQAAPCLMCMLHCSTKTARCVLLQLRVVDDSRNDAIECIRSHLTKQCIQVACCL